MATGTYTWGEFRDAVLSFLTDRQPSDDHFVSAVTEYVRARIARDMLGQADLYSIAQNRYTALRRGLAGHQVEMSDADLKEAVRAQLSDGARTTQQAARAAGLYMRAELVREVDMRGGANEAVYNSLRQDYQALRVRLCGYNTTSQTAAQKFIPVDAVRENTTDLRASLYAAAIEDIAAFGTWLDRHVLAAKADIESMNDRVQKELRAGVIDLQRYIRAYQIGHTETYTEFDVNEDGMASSGQLPDNAQVREAWVYYPGYTDSTDAVDDDIEDAANRQKAELVAWSDRQALMIGTRENGPQIAIDPTGTSFLCTPKLVDRETELRLVYDGLKLEFDDDDDVPFDEDAARAVGYKINAEMAAEWGDTVAQVALWQQKYQHERTRLYLVAKRRAEVA